MINKIAKAFIDEEFSMFRNRTKSFILDLYIGSWKRVCEKYWELEKQGRLSKDWFQSFSQEMCSLVRDKQESFEYIEERRE